MSFWARLGHPGGSAVQFGPFFEIHPEFARQAPDIHDLVAQPRSLFESEDRPNLRE